MSRKRNKKIDPETVTIKDIVKSLNLKHCVSIVSVLTLILGTAYGYGYSTAQQTANKEAEIKTLKVENEKLKNEINAKSFLQPRKEIMVVIVVSKKVEQD